MDYKASIADTIIAVIEENPEAKENGLSHLCEFIEDCEHTSLAVKILHLLGTASVLWIRIRIHKDPYQIKIRIRTKICKLDPEPDPNSHQFADVKPKCIEYEPILALFQGFEPFFKLESGSGSG